MSEINFFEVEVKSALKQRRKLKTYINKIFAQEAKIIESISIIFCTDKYLLSINKEYLNHDFFTDTITFTLSPKNYPVIGDIYISTERVKENAKKYFFPFQTELLRVIIHSCLHLCGYKDKPKKNRIKMEQKQELYLKEWFVSRETKS